VTIIKISTLVNGRGRVVVGLFAFTKYGPVSSSMGAREERKERDRMGRNTPTLIIIFIFVPVTSPQPPLLFFMFPSLSPSPWNKVEKKENKEIQ
jgi:hypothetical protein